VGSPTVLSCIAIGICELRDLCPGPGEPVDPYAVVQAASGYLRVATHGLGPWIWAYRPPTVELRRGLVRRRAGIKLKKPVRPSAWVRRFPVIGGLLLLDDSSSRLFAFNDTARHVWDLIEAGRFEGEIASEFARAWQIPLSQARGDIESILQQWRMQGLLAGGEIKPAVAAPDGSDTLDREPITLSKRWQSEWTCTIRQTTIAFAVENGTTTAIRSMLAHLETSGAHPQARIEIRKTSSDELVLLTDGIERVRTSDEGILVGGVWQAILEYIHPNAEWLALIHGAAVARNGDGIALCGPSGSGKSTLAAGLMEAGFDYLADDLVAVSASGGTIVPWPMPVSVKPGSFDAVALRRPDLARAPSYRTKGVEARLLVPPPTAWDVAEVRLRFLVFPRFTLGAAPQLQRISTFEAIERLLNDRVWIGYPITADRVANFLAWLNDRSAYVTTYGTLEDGIRLIEDLAA
jgi:hypothetical protein